MTSDDLLIISLAFVPALIVAHFWWYVIHTGEDLTGYRSIGPVEYED